MTEVKLNRTLAGELRWLLHVAEGLKGGRVEFEPLRTRKGVRAILMHNDDGVALVGIGDDATKATHELVDAIERETARFVDKRRSA